MAKLSGGDIETGDWTDTEKGQIRHRLGINGELASPTQVPSLARPGDAMNLTLAAMQSANIHSHRLVKIPFAYYVERVYPYGNLSGLGI